MTKYRDLIDVWTESAERLGYDLTLADGETLGWKVVRPDFTTRDGYRWPFPGGAVTSRGVPGGACPSFEGDGFCVARDAAGASSSGIGLHLVILLAWRDRLGSDENKIRVKSARVLALVDARAANLRSADLRSADLYAANLRSANLRSADLRSADLYAANLRLADLYAADLRSANLYAADLRLADLYAADLRSAFYDNRTVWPDGFDVASSGAIRG